MDFKIKKMTVKDSREIKNEIELLAKKANAESQNLGVVLDREIKEGLKEINLNVKKETAEQYRKLFSHKLSLNNNDIVSHLLECNTRNTFDKTRSAFRFCIAEKIQELRKESEQARREKNYDLMQKKTIEAYQMFFFFQRDFLSENRVTWNDISYRKIDSKSKKKTMNSVSTIKAIFEDLKQKPELFDKYSLILAISSLTGCRPAEIQKGVRLEVSPPLLNICISGAKVGEDRGQEKRILKFNIKEFAQNEQFNLIMSKIKQNNKFEYKCSKQEYDSLRQYLYINHPGFSLYTLRHRAASELKKDGFSEEMIAAFLGHRVTRSLENYGYARSGKGGPKVAGVEHSNAIKSNTRRYKSKTTPGGGNPSPTRKRALK
ncbi:TPA: hypothetical protein ACWL6Y_005301 [Klebsiella pneumoniae]